MRLLAMMEVSKCWKDETDKCLLPLEVKRTCELSSFFSFASGGVHASFSTSLSS